MSEYRYERGPIQWDPIDAPAPDNHGAVFEDLLARAALESPDIAAAIDRTQHAATPADASDTDTSDDRELVDGAIALRAAVDAQGDVRVTDEIGALDGIDPEIAAGAQDIPPEEDEGRTDYIDERRAPSDREPGGRGGDDGDA